MPSAEREIDQTVNPERLGLKLVKVLVISGPSYSGKDMLADELSRRHGWPVEDGKGRFERRTGIETGHMRRSLDIHRRFDGFQAKFFRTATPSDAVIWQTRLGGIILAEERDRRARKIRENLWAKQRGEDRPELGMIPAVSVLLWARKDVRTERAYKDALLRWEQETAYLPEGAEKPAKPTKAEFEIRIDKRAEGDIENWAPLHPKYVRRGEDPFSRKLKRQHGGPVYDVFIDTSDMTLEEVTDAVELEIVKFGAIEFPNQEELIFDSESTGQHLGEPISPRPNTTAQ